ncbi:MAG: nucleoside-diphosphate kinase [Dehalococcoidia bacterium]|jgi:nucleoside-diphosphate kinase|nr:nucleoside-diphosphate kinase [Dehalococcoidia bacterium]
MERTLVLIKPDAIQRGLAGEIISRLERRGLRIVAMKMMRLDQSLAHRHYAEHREKPFFPSLVRFITSAPLIACVMEGPHAIEVVRQTMGATDPKKAAPGTIRGDLGLDITHNLVHGSDSPQTAQREIALFFQEDEILSYERDIDRWAFGSGE